MIAGFALVLAGFTLAASETWIADRLFYNDTMPRHMIWLSARIAMIYGIVLVLAASFAS